MAIPGLRPEYPLKAKVRVGEKVYSEKAGRDLPTSTDHFLCDDPDFQRVVGEKPKSLQIYLPHRLPEDNFPTGLERWDGAMLTCYSKGQEEPPIAFRKKELKSKGKTFNLLEGFEVRGNEMGNNRCPVTCRVRECPDLKKKLCKPMGRLQFWIDGIDRRLGVFQIDTKSWHTVENLEAALSLLGNPQGQVLTLKVAMQSLGTNRFPVLSIDTEATVEINSPADADLADAVVQLRVAHESYTHSDDPPETGFASLPAMKVELAKVLDLSNPGWRDSDTIIQWVQEQGVVAASAKILARHQL